MTIRNDASYEGPAVLVADDGTLTEGHANIQLTGGPTPFGGAEIDWDATVDVQGPVPSGIIMATKALRVDGAPQDMPVEVVGVAVRQRGEELQVTLRGGRHMLGTP